MLLMVICELLPHLISLDAGGVRLAAWEWPGEGPPLVFAHATSFHGRVWDAVIRALGGRRAIAIEMRGHGRSDKPEPPYDWRWFARDVVAAAEQLNLRGAIGIGHSMGGYAVATAAALRPEAFAALLLVDPTIFPPEAYGGARREDVSFILRRRNQWKSPEEMFERFRHRPPFAAWRPEVLRNYCEFGLLAQDGEYALACPPRVEAAIYASSKAPEADPYLAISAITLPVTVMRAGRVRSGDGLDLAASPTAPDLARKFRCGRDVLLGGRSHYIPMEAPELVAQEIGNITTP
jgi:lipase